MLAMQGQKAELKTGDKKTVIVIPINDELKSEALKIATMLRDAHMAVEVEVMGRKMAKALEDANRRKMDYAVIVGEQELKDGAVVVKDLVKREQKTVKIENITAAVKGSVA
jgi:histidyl-tRNA synthetase